VHWHYLLLLISSVATGGMGARAPQPQSGRVMGIAEIRGEKFGGGVGVPDHIGQTNYAEICILHCELKNKTPNSCP